MTTEKKIEKLKAKIAKLQSELAALQGGGMQTMDGGPRNPVPPDPTHPPKG